jgi:hypothetical protein
LRIFVRQAAGKAGTEYALEGLQRSPHPVEVGLPQSLVGGIDRVAKKDLTDT